MKKQTFFLIILLSLTLTSIAYCRSEGRDSLTVNDGPYIFLVNDTLKAKWVEKNLLRQDYLLPDDATDIEVIPDHSLTYRELLKVFRQKPDYGQSYKRVDSIGVISDVHGQLGIFLHQLEANGIIDRNLNWSFGKGHLVVLGDIFDRGDMVTEILWRVFILEKQAAKAGGMVHVVLGNHDVMVINNDLRYINEKYKDVESIAHTSYSDLYADNSVLGRWLRSKPVIMTINNIIFVHGGLSPAVIENKLDIKKINQIFSEEIVGKPYQPGQENEMADLLEGNEGPLWYRGYFNDTTFYESRLDSILAYFKKEHIVVGHTTHKELKSLFGNKIFGIDAGITYRQPGVMLIYKEGRFYKGSANGERVRL